MGKISKIKGTKMDVPKLILFLHTNINNKKWDFLATRTETEGQFCDLVWICRRMLLPSTILAGTAVVSLAMTGVFQKVKSGTRSREKKIIHRHWRHLSRVGVLLTQPRCVGVPADLLERRNMTSIPPSVTRVVSSLLLFDFIMYYLFYCCFVCVSRAQLVPGGARIGQQNFGTGVIDSHKSS